MLRGRPLEAPLGGQYSRCGVRQPLSGHVRPATGWFSAGRVARRWSSSVRRDGADPASPLE